MSVKERIFHCLLFELTAILMFVPLSMWVTGEGAMSMSGLAISLSLLAMSWNYLFNVLFDRWFGYDRINRTLKVRVLHSVLFEVVLTFSAIPLIMWWTKLDLWTVILLDIGAVLFFLVFTVVFNWCYDHLRHRWLLHRQAKLQAG